MLGEEAVVAEEAPVLVVVLSVDQGGVTLSTHEAFVMPVAFSVIDQVLDMNGQPAALADLGNRLSLKIIAPRRNNELSSLTLITHIVFLTHCLHFSPSSVRRNSPFLSARRSPQVRHLKHSG